MHTNRPPVPTGADTMSLESYTPPFQDQVDSFKAELETKEAEITKLRQEAVATEGAGKVEIARLKAAVASEAAAAEVAAAAAAAEIATLKAKKPPPAIDRAAADPPRSHPSGNALSRRKSRRYMGMGMECLHGDKDAHYLYCHSLPAWLFTRSSPIHRLTTHTGRLHT